MDTWPAARVPSLPGHAPEIVVWDTATREPAVAAPGPLATLYACGITPYDATHIGHASTYVAWDLLVRAWRDAGHEVRYAQNVTDIDDPLLERAKRDGDDWRELADREIDRYRSDMTALRVLPPDFLIGAVEALGEIDEFSGTLADRGSLYELDGDVYFVRCADPLFGSVSGYGSEMMLQLSAERGGDPGRPGKKDPLDPLVWLARRPGEPFWDSRFGLGRPGWHVECAAIATRYLGVSFDVQAGGEDLIFPHHEMSASHARVAFAIGAEAAFARRYCHAGMVRLDGEKMSKSLGNLVFVSDLRDSGVDPMAIRLAIMGHHYRRGWDWTDEGLQHASRRLDRWRSALSAALGAGPGGAAGAGPGGAGAAGAGSAATPDESGTAAGAVGTVAPSAPGAAAAGGAVPPGEDVLAGMRQRLADDLDAPGAIAVVDAWAEAVLAGPGRGTSGEHGESARLVADAVDALLGVAL